MCTTDCPLGRRAKPSAGFRRYRSPALVGPRNQPRRSCSVHPSGLGSMWSARRPEGARTYDVDDGTARRLLSGGGTGELVVGQVTPGTMTGVAGGWRRVGCRGLLRVTRRVIRDPTRRRPAMYRARLGASWHRGGRMRGPIRRRGRGRSRRRGLVRGRPGRRFAGRCGR